MGFDVSMPVEYATCTPSVNAAYFLPELRLPYAGTVRGVEKHQHDPADKVALGLRLKSCRELKGWKQDFAAKELGITKAALSAWETGRNMPDALWLRRLSKLYGVSVDAILWDDPVTNEAMQFAAQFDALTDRQRTSLKILMKTFIEEAAPDHRVEAAFGEAQERERRGFNTPDGFMESPMGLHQHRRATDKKDGTR